MLTIKIPDMEYFDEESQEFVSIKGRILELEHSLISISKWEAKWHKPFLSTDERTVEQTIDYIKCMTINSKGIDDTVYNGLSMENIKAINDYINDSMSATWFNDQNNKKPSREVVTSELIYYWMVAYQIPSEYEKWHLNRLMNLIRICNIKNQPDKKMSKSAIMRQNRALNEARKKKFNTSG